MARINLLPWRSERRRLREREFYMMLLGAALAAVALVLLLVFAMNMRISDQEARNDYLKSEIGKLDEQIKEIEKLDTIRQQLMTRKGIIEKLQANRSQMVHLFDEMVRTIPDGVRLTSMKQSGEVLTLEGVAESSTRVATYMCNVDRSRWMGRSELRKIENKAGSKDAPQSTPYVFSLDVRLNNPEAPEEEGASAGGGKAAAGAVAASGPQDANGGAAAPDRKIDPCGLTASDIEAAAAAQQAAGDESAGGTAPAQPASTPAPAANEAAKSTTPAAEPGAAPAQGGKP
jgi:type IV pilus assembly protein PilN